jgi:hypothetical protein
LRSLEKLETDRQRAAARAVLLGAAQWAIDGRRTTASGDELAGAAKAARDLLYRGLADLRGQASTADLRPHQLEQRLTLRLATAATAARSRALNRFAGRVQLVVTSPPYPGVHVLYHRWQVGGRSETPLPYWVAGMQDGLGAKHYTMGGRSAQGEDLYFATIESTWRAILRLLAPGAVVVQLVSFADAPAQMPRYQAAMHAAGYEPAITAKWRQRLVPNRKWYFRTRPDRGDSHEVLMLHVPRGKA